MRKRLLIILPTVVVAIVGAVAALGLSPWLSNADNGGDGGTLEAQDASASDAGLPAGSTTPGVPASDTSSAATTKDAEDNAENEGGRAEETGAGGESENAEATTEDEGGMVDPAGEPPR